MKRMLQIVSEKAILLTRLECVFNEDMAKKATEWPVGTKMVLRTVDASEGFHDTLPVGQLYDVANLLPPAGRGAHLERTEYDITVSKGEKVGE